MEFKFTPLETFEWVREYEDGSSKLIGQYHPGMTYNCTKEPRHDALRVKCVEWEEKGMIRKIPLTLGEAFKVIEIGDTD